MRLNWGFAQVTVNGGAPAGSDAVRVVGDATADDRFTYAATAYNQGTLTVLSPQPAGATTIYQLDDVESLAVDGRAAADDELRVTNVNAVVTPGYEPGSGLVEPFSSGGAALLTLSYLHFEDVAATGTSVVIDATEANDQISLSDLGILTITNTLNGTNSIDVAAYTNLTINALGGDDTITIASGAPFERITVLGGDNGTGSDRLIVNDKSVTVDFDVNEVQGVAAPGPIVLDGLEILEVNGTDGGAADAVTVVGYGSATGVQTLILDGQDPGNNDGDTIDVNLALSAQAVEFTPTSAGTGQLILAVAPRIAVQGFNNAAGGLTLNGSASPDSLTLAGTPGVDAIAISGTAMSLTVGADVGPGGLHGPGSPAGLGPRGQRHVHRHAFGADGVRGRRGPDRSQRRYAGAECEYHGHLQRGSGERQRLVRDRRSGPGQF